ncbi:MAG: HIRAN domain-containing protein [Prevotella sp.]
MDTSSRDKQTYRIAGLTYHITLSESECGEFDGFIEPEPTNRHDPNALVIKKRDGRKMGYIQRDMTEIFRTLHGRRRVPCTINIQAITDGGDLVFIKGYATVSSKVSASHTERDTQPANKAARRDTRKSVPAKKPLRQSGEGRGANTAYAHPEYNIPEGKNPSPLTPFEMFLCFMALVALLLLLAHFFSS